MRIEGKMTKSGKWWAVEIPLLLIHTQGKTRKDAYRMVRDAVESLVDQKDFKVRIENGENETFCISSNHDAILMSLALQQHRAENNLSVRDVMRALKSTSPNAYSRYERGKVKTPSLDTFSRLLKAINPKLEPIIKI